MIDTDKYEGHTPAPWGRDCDCLFEYDTDLVIARLTMDNSPNAQLIADAPLLLAEVKRLREGIQQIIEYNEGVDADMFGSQVPDKLKELIE